MQPEFDVNFEFQPKPSQRGQQEGRAATQGLSFVNRQCGIVYAGKEGRDTTRQHSTPRLRKRQHGTTQAAEHGVTQHHKEQHITAQCTRKEHRTQQRKTAGPNTTRHTTNITAQPSTTPRGTARHMRQNSKARHKHHDKPQCSTTLNSETQRSTAQRQGTQQVKQHKVEHHNTAQQSTAPHQPSHPTSTIRRMWHSAAPNSTEHRMFYSVFSTVFLMCLSCCLLLV